MNPQHRRRKVRLNYACNEAVTHRYLKQQQNQLFEGAQKPPTSRRILSSHGFPSAKSIELQFSFHKKGQYQSPGIHTYIHKLFKNGGRINCLKLWDNPLKPIGYQMYHLTPHYKTLHYFLRMECIFCIVLTKNKDCFLNNINRLIFVAKLCVFPVRYEL